MSPLTVAEVWSAEHADAAHERRSWIREVTRDLRESEALVERQGHEILGVREVPHLGCVLRGPRHARSGEGFSNASSSCAVRHDEAAEIVPIGSRRG